jgi:hypothetical protein
MITWDTDVNAPCCPGQIVNDDGRTVLIQTDWDYCGVATTFGWPTRNIQRCPACGKVQEVSWKGNDQLCENCDARWKACDHNYTDGTVDCPDCGIKATDFITAAREYLDNNDGATADDPGYFGE